MTELDYTAFIAETKLYYLSGWGGTVKTHIFEWSMRCLLLKKRLEYLPHEAKDVSFLARDGRERSLATQLSLEEKLL